VREPLVEWVRRLRWFELVPEVVLVAGLSLFAVNEPRAAFSAFKSTKAVVLVAAVTIGWALARVVSLAVVRWVILRMAVFAVAAAAVLNVVVLPAYRDRTVVEAMPDPSAAAAAGPVRIRTGSLRGIDHRASGTVNVYRRPGGDGLVVGLERFSIQPGPAYALYVVPGADRRSPEGGVRIERLRGNKGTQFYDVAGAALGAEASRGPLTVLVWCELFDVPVANATPIAG
jgi:hypothetical protein